MTATPPEEPGPARDVLLFSPQGLGVPSAPARDPFGVLARRRRKYATAGPQWFSRLGYFLGPFEGSDALGGAVEFFRKTSIAGKPPQVYLTATHAGLGIIPTSNWMMRRARGTQDVLWISYDDIRTVELHPASTARMSVTVPGTSSKLGQVVIITHEDRTARLSGTTVDGLHALLVSLGARDAGPAEGA